MVGSIDHKKNPVMWIEVLSRLMQIDVRYTLKIAGRIQELRYKYYMKSIVPKLGLTNNIRFFGHVDDVAKWFETNDINYLLTTSPFESFGYSIAEAMAMGYRPLIHAFPSAEEMWPADCVFGCTDELIRLIFDRQSYDSLKYRQFVEKRYSLQSQLEKIEALLKEMADGISSEATFSERRCRNEAHKQWNIPTALARYHRPEKTVIVTGIPRSGTSLFSALLNDIDNAVCLNEILYDVNSLPSAFAEIRRRLIAGESIPNRYDSSGNLATDTQGSGANVQERIVQDVDENAVIGSKINIPYLNQIQKILDYGYKVIAIVRDPVYTIASWNSEKANIIPEAHVADEDMHPRWQRFKFTSDDKIERQAQIWNFYANLIWSLRNKIKIYTYELLTSDMEWVIKDMSEFIGLEPSTNMLETSNQNIESKYPKIEEIKEAVKKYCPVKDVFAYNYLDYEVPAEHGAQHRANTEEDDKKCGQNVLELRY
ncbi:MAG: glycosyltransferase family 4 protein [Proteobacteria bacterium]|nr:glycosyltransferase family 4 protein [Pseudomonadota bacterium]